MLVLSRRIDEKIVIGRDVFITVLEVQGKRVKLGIEAPIEVRVERQEVANREVREESKPEVE